MTYHQEPPDEADYRLDQESDERDAAEAEFVDGYAKAGAPLSSEERDVAAQAWLYAWTAGASFERKWAAAHQSAEQESV